MKLLLTPTPEIELCKELVPVILQSIIEVANVDLPNFHRENGFVTYNCRPALFWDYLNSHIVQKLPEDHEYIIIKCGMWEVLLLHHLKSQTVITLMRRKRFDVLNASDITKCPIYLRRLLSLNKDLIPVNQQQSFGFYEKADDPFYEAALLDPKLTSIIKDEKLKHVLVIFDEQGGDVYSLDAMVLTPAMEEVKRVDLLNHSTPVFQDEHVELDSFNQGGKLTLTAKAIERKRNSEAVSLKNASELNDIKEKIG